MRDEMTHERCSELLLPYAEGSLEDALADGVAQHLSGCDECAGELAGLTALRAPMLETTLTDLERKRLRAGISAGLESAEVAPARSEGWRAHAAPLLAAAALVALVAVGFLVWSGSRTDAPLSTAGRDTRTENRTADTFGTEAGAGQAQGAAAQDAADEVAPETAELEAAAPGDDSGGGAATTNQNTRSQAVAGTLPYGGGPVITDEPYARARFEPSSLVPPRFPGPRASAVDYLKRITRTVDDATVSALIRTCAAKTNAGGFPWLPASATYYRADEILVIGFIRPVRASRILEYELRGWHRDCDHPAPIYRTGRL